MDANVALPAMLTQAQAADYLGMSAKKLERDRWCEKRIPYVKMGKHVRYRACDILDYINSCIVGEHSLN